MALSGLSPIPLETFKGLDLQTDPEQIGNGAVDSLNVLYDGSGSRVGSRWGYDVFATPAGSRAPESIAYYEQSGNPYWLTWERDSGGFHQYVLYNVSAGVAASIVAGGANPFSSTRFGTPTTARLYVADGDVYRVDGATITAIFTRVGLSPYAARHVCATADGRLAYASCYGTPNRVYFSDPGVPETIGTNNYVTLSPGDGESITGMCLYREQLFVFKETKFFIFYGTSTDSTGNPLFNYRTVNTGLGAADGSLSAPGVCVAREGVYFTNGKSIYRTTGGDCTRVSKDIDPYLQLITLPLFGQTSLTAYAGTQSAIKLRWLDERLYVLLTPVGGSSGVSGMFVLDVPTGIWSFWDAPVSDLIPGRDSVPDERMWGVSPISKKIVRFKQSLTADNGAAISSRLVSGFMDLGSPGAEKVIRETQITGQGTISFGWARDFNTSPTMSSVTLGTAPAVARGLHRAAQQGETLSYKITATGPWQVNRIVPMVRSVRGTGERTS